MVISPHSLGSRQVTNEIIRAHESSREFAPVLQGITHVEFQNRQPEWREAPEGEYSINLIVKDNNFMGTLYNHRSSYEEALLIANKTYDKLNKYGKNIFK
ncbi:hypothetical protein ACFLU1_06870 [Chloroflexota bacterium]